MHTAGTALAIIFRLEEIAFDDRIWRYMLTRVSDLEPSSSVWIEAALAAKSSGHRCRG